MATINLSEGPTQKVAEFLVINKKIDDNALVAFNKDGVVCLRNAFSKQWLDKIEQGILKALNGTSENIDIVKKSQDKGRFSFSSQAWKNVSPFKEFIFESPMADIAWPFLESRYMSLFYDFLLIKEAQSNHALTPWHQDHAYYPLKGTKAINCWVALDPIPESTALRFCVGSHQSKTLYRAVNFDDENDDYLHARKDRPEIPSIEIGGDEQVSSTEMNPGDMLIWSSYTLHCAPGNHLDKRRAAFSVNWIGDDITYDEIPALDSYLDPSLKTGDRVISDKFPLVRGTIE